MRSRNRSIRIASVSVALLCLFNASTVQADAATQRLQLEARDILLKPYFKAPFNCDDSGWVSAKDRHVLDIAPWVQAAGLRRGDRLLTFGGLSLANATSISEVWAQLPHSEYVEIVAERAGKEVIIRLPCRDGSQAWQASIDTARAVDEGRWQDCIDASRRYNRVAGIAPATSLYVALICMRGRAEVAKQPLPDEHWRQAHTWATKVIQEARYRPTGLTELRPVLIAMTEALEKVGRKNLADDIKQQIASFNQTPSTPVATERKVGQRVGTGFVIRPDGVLLTAFHVVKDASEIEVSCPEVPKASAALEQFSEANDLAVLRLADARTPTYLSLADQKSAAIGDQVFTVGYPAPNLLGGEAKFTEGVISSLSVGGDAGYMQISVPVQPGNSGGALINRSGDVVGVVIASASALTFLKGTGTLPQNVSWAVKGAFAAPLYDLPARSPKVTERGTIIRRAVNATCSVRVLVQTDQ